jgi:hydrogenase maturation protease
LATREPGFVIRVIGMGAEDRGDDAAGLLVARLLRTAAPPGVQVHESSGDAGGLLELVEGADRLVLVDAARGGGAPGTVECVPLTAALRSPVHSTHGLGLAEALGVATQLGILPPLVRMYVVYGRSFDPGPVTAEVAAGVGAAADLILRDEFPSPRPR